MGRPEADRAPDLAALLGKVPYLNGGLFDLHDLERDNPDISVPDVAFENVFRFFDDYTWHLDDRPGKKDNEINPDVLGYIFEKYVNQKQMGAYYTKEDITGYISRNTVIPFLFNAATKECPVAFAPGGGVWRLLQEDPDRYIYPAVGHGVAWAYSADAVSERLEESVNRQRKWDTLEGLKTREFEGGVSSRTEGRVPKERSRRVPVTSRQSRGRRGADRADQVLRQTSQSSYPA